MLFLLAAAVTPVPTDYRVPANWLCRPGRADACAGDIAATIVALDGTQTVEPAAKRAAPKADCFYVYPTTSMDPTPHSDLIAGDGETGMAASQAAPFRSACRVFAPLYRSVTLPALRAAMRTGTRLSGADFELPYADVRAAFRAYLTRDNHGRPFALIGHSQGSALLKRLVIEEIDDKPIQRQMLSAILPGTAVLVPRGRDVGGDLKSVPLCRAATQTGCVVTWASYRDTNPPPANALFGRAGGSDLVAGCTNPAHLTGGVAPLDPLLGFPWWRGGVAQFKQPAIWAARGKPVGTRFVRMPGLLSGACVARGDVRYLAVQVTPGAATDLVAATVGPDTVGDTAYPDWGFHVIDIAIVERDLIRLVAAQSAAWHKRK
ncbi:DUF3089 domain-containing protein [Sphingomonas psychrolutea]|uniref:Lysophospholipase n=1 Tax=Sphingomonas psychrolutea TaxID=1259676 RepID=A0ABQ1H2Z1_9SPHN|nr:DUF3089 domain-containing protein [Sphingomonas psychrolutea]GGA56039.1 lysophospholipase [Sphingomonas psychrolutea]